MLKSKPPVLPDDGLQDPDHFPSVWRMFRGLPDQEPWRHILASLRTTVDPLYYSRHLAPTYLVGRNKAEILLIYTYMDHEAVKLTRQIGPKITELMGTKSVRFFDGITALRDTLEDEP